MRLVLIAMQLLLVNLSDYDSQLSLNLLKHILYIIDAFIKKQSCRLKNSQLSYSL